MTGQRIGELQPMAKTTLGICVGLLTVFAITSWVAVSGKSSTYDEPVHALGSWLVLHDGDYRIDPENPPLWQHWAALANGGDALRIDRSDPRFAAILNENQDLRYGWVVRQLYQTPGNDGEHFVRNERGMMLIVGVMLGALIALSSWRIGGSVAAIVATTLFVFDPSFLGHAALVKNDVALAAALTWMSMALWQAGGRVTWWSVLNLSLALAAALTIKFTALLAPMIVAGMLALRALWIENWPCGKSVVRARGPKLMMAACVVLSSALVFYLIVWACYHFRFDATPQPGVPLELGTVYRAAVAGGQSPGALYGLMEWAQTNRLLPQAFLDGVNYQILMEHRRNMFLLGEFSYTGWWYYFPLAILFKTPITTIVVVGFVLVWALVALSRKRRWRAHWWTVACLAGPALVLLIFAMQSGVNVGLRHILFIYPPAYIAAGIIAAKIDALRPRLTRGVLLGLGIVLAVESFAAFPNYIAYFNLAAGGSRGGLDLLGDSNLDWGQDLPALAQWHREHADVPLYIAYFGSVDPRVYDIPLQTPPGQNGVLAESATYLQGIYADESARRQIAYLRTRQPIAVLNGSIYLYNWTPADTAAILNYP